MKRFIVLLLTSGSQPTYEGLKLPGRILVSLVAAVPSLPMRD